jgi:hypothetical protein
MSIHNNPLMQEALRLAPRRKPGRAEWRFSPLAGGLPLTFSSPPSTGTLEGSWRALEGIDSHIDRADYPPAAFLDVWYPDEQLWCTWCIGVQISQLGDVYTLLELYYVERDGTDVAIGLFRCCETDDIIYRRLVDMGLPPPVPEDVLPVYTLVLILGDDDLTCRS